VSILNTFFGKKHVIGVEIFGAATALGALPAMTISFQDQDTFSKLVARTDESLSLHGELTAFFQSHFDVPHQPGAICLHDRPLTDAEWRSFLNDKFRGKKWKYSRYTGITVEYVIVVVFG
jgi:hypothetical protein